MNLLGTTIVVDFKYLRELSLCLSRMGNNFIIVLKRNDVHLDASIFNMTFDLGENKLTIWLSNISGVVELSKVNLIFLIYYFINLYVLKIYINFLNSI
jgi:hypothetical protein